MEYLIDNTKIEGCDRKSRVYCSSYNALQPIVFTDNNTVEIDGKTVDVNTMSDFDLSALGLYIGKYVEQEINSSVVQLMRYCCGIDMPDNYCKRYLGWDCDADIQTGNGSCIRLNEQIPGSNPLALRSIPLGNAYYAMRAMNKEDPEVFSGYPWLLEKQFQEAWRHLFLFRNKSAHSGDIITREDIKKNHNVFMTFLKYMPKIVELKNELAPGGNFENFDQNAEIPHADHKRTAIKKTFDDGFDDGYGYGNSVMRSEINMDNAFILKHFKKSMEEFIEDEFYPNYIFKHKKKMSYGLMDSNFNVVIEDMIDKYYVMDDVSFLYQSGEFYGLYQDSKEVLLQPIYDNIEWGEKGGPLLFTLNGELGFVTIKGEFIPKSQKDLKTQKQWEKLADTFVRESYNG